MKSFLFAGLLCAMISGPYPLLFAIQPFTVSGVVHDVSGARIPHAHVALHLASSSAVLEAETNDQGEFRVEAPGAGDYRIEVTAEGFKPQAAQAVLTAQAPEAQLDLNLEIGSQTETVEVTAEALAAETTSTQLGETLDAKKMVNVPLNGRSFTDLMAVQPGIVPANTAQPGAVIMTGVASTPPSGNANPGNLSISGQREASNGFRVNGSDVEEDVNMGTSIVPNLDSIDSFRVLTSNFDAEYGNSSGGQVLVTTKAGTAAMAWIGFRIPAQYGSRCAQLFFADRAAYRQNQFGAKLGGTPFHKSVAVFADYQGTRLTEGIDTGDIAVPSNRGAQRRFQPASTQRQGEWGPWAALLSTRLGRR